MSLHLSAAELCAKGARRDGEKVFRWAGCELRRKQRKEIITTGQIRKCSYSISTQRLQGGLFSVRVSPLRITAEGTGWSRATSKCFNWKSFESLVADFCPDDDCERSRLLLWLQTDNHALICAPKFSNHSEMAQWSIKQKEFTINWTTMIQLNFFVDDCLVHDWIVNGKLERK